MEDVENGLGQDDLELSEPTLRENVAEVWERMPSVGRVGVVALATLLVVLACSVLAAILGEITSTDSSHSVSTTVATATASMPTATTNPNAALASLVRTAVGPQALSVRADIDPTYTVIGVVVTVGEQPDLASAQETVKAVVFAAQSAIWQQGGYAPDTVVVTVLGPNFHSGVISTGEYGEAKISAKTVSQFDWNALTPDTAWRLYDSVKLIGGGTKSSG